MIDLHLHTTASDGRCSPRDLVARVHAAGVRVFSVTDHDTVAAHAEAAAEAAARGLQFVPGIEITAVWRGRDVHVLGYWIDAGHLPLQTFLRAQRQRRLDRTIAIVDALAALGAPIDVSPLLADAARRPGTSVGRPGIARLLVRAGHAASTQEAFERWLGEGRPAYVPRRGPPPAEVCAAIHEAGGIASLAHPGVTRRDEMLETWASAGLDALEAHHSDHDADTERRYVERAAGLGLQVTGGSDFHGDEPMSHRTVRRIAGATLPDGAWETLRAYAASRAA